MNSSWGVSAYAHTELVGAASHDRSGLARFQNGEERLVYARLKSEPDAPLYFLQDGTAREVREWAREHLECFMPDCDARQITTVARSTRRDGFSHMRGAGGHARESLFHQHNCAPDQPRLPAHCQTA